MLLSLVDENCSPRGQPSGSAAILALQSGDDHIIISIFFQRCSQKMNHDGIIDFDDNNEFNDKNNIIVVSL